LMPAKAHAMRRDPIPAMKKRYANAI